MPTIQLRRDIALNWTTTNPVLALGEIGVETDSSPIRFKVGNGSTAWSSLSYFIQESSVDAKITTASNNIKGGASSGYDTLLELENFIKSLSTNKVDKVEGEGLSTNDFTDTYKNNVVQNTVDRHVHANQAALDNIAGDPNEILVLSKEDLPTPVAGVITLEDNKVYSIRSQILLGTDRIEAGDNCYLKGNGFVVSGIHYTGSGSLITSNATSIAFDGLSMSATGGKIFNCTGGLTDCFFAFGCKLTNSVKLGDITGFDIAFFDKIKLEAFNSGVSFYGESNRLKLTNMHVHASRLSGTGAIQVVRQEANSTINVGGQISLSSFKFEHVDDKVLVIDPTSDIGNGLISENVAIGPVGFSALESNLPNNIIVNNNNGIEDFTSIAVIGFTENTTDTVLTQNTWTKIAGITSAKILSRLDSPESNRVRFLGTRSENFALTAFIDAEKLTPGAATIQFAFFKNGSRITDILKEVTYDGAGQVKSITIGTAENLTQNDYIEIYTQNTENNDNVLVKNLQIRVSK